MKILYLHQYFATPDSNAGTRSYEIAKRLVARGHTVEFVTSSAFYSNAENLRKGWNFVELEGFKLHILKQDYSNKLSYPKRVYRFLSFCLRATLKSLQISSDVVFATSTPLTIAIPGIIYKKFRKKPLVFEVRDLWPELPIAIGALKSPLLIKLAQLLERTAYSNSSRIVGLSPGMCRGVLDKGIDEDKIVLAPNSCDTDLFSVDPSVGHRYLESNFGFVAGRKLVVYAGTFGAINNVGYLVNLAKELKKVDKSICIVAIGDGMEKDTIEDNAMASGVLNDNLYLLPPVAKTEIVKVLSGADMALSLFGPIKEMWHNSANKLFDALASGTPVAINYGGWQSEFIKQHKCGLVLSQNDFKDAALAISQFLSSEEELCRAKDACAYLANHKFSRVATVDSVESALLEAVNESVVTN
ncbi:glycosyltransferase family 4 protein [Alteromonas hispanica]|uniref:Glycosyltransferase n=1 Tax=Alteromonas hispanica TaxID=315421 RepID=A0A6L9MYG5_9ALTE|nr:glycosyltransferase family 4 protein [Alteromonas hispanica]NDW23206.1 glycosyltransferase [Alteromonas hispanica]